MINLAGDQRADEYVQRELSLAGINIAQGERSEGEVPYSITGKLGAWDFIRAWYYWMANAEDGNGLPLEVAIKLHKRKYPNEGEDSPRTYGKVIRVAGDCGCPHPRGHARFLDSENRLLVFDPKGKERRFLEGGLERGEFSRDFADKYHCVETREGFKTLTIKAVISSYHIDTQTGLNEFARVIKSL